MNLSNGRIWPYTIAVMIVLVFSFCVATVIVTVNADVQMSDLYMDDYHEVDKNSNEIIEARIAFDKKYSVKYIADSLSVDDVSLRVIIDDLEKNPVNSAKLSVFMNRSEKDLRVDFSEPTISEGTYIFKSVTLPKEGVWDLMIKINIGENYKFYSLKADTRTKEIFNRFDKLQIGKKTREILK
ncbi:MAG: FixH family protein [Campylobacterota bacterium]|nr:FixH family protein [Campylobacterota bacterium]